MQFGGLTFVVLDINSILLTFVVWLQYLLYFIVDPRRMCLSKTFCQK